MTLHHPVHALDIASCITFTRQIYHVTSSATEDCDIASPDKEYTYIASRQQSALERIIIIASWWDIDWVVIKSFYYNALVTSEVAHMALFCGALVGQGLPHIDFETFYHRPSVASESCFNYRITGEF